MVLTGVQGEMHQVGANMVADVLEFHGWEVRFLGTNLPQAGILRVVEEQRPDVVGISATMLFNLPRVRELIESIRALPDPTAPHHRRRRGIPDGGRRLAGGRRGRLRPRPRAGGRAACAMATKARRKQGW